ncbi:hypothetical protein [Anaerocellum diazotrophicum]|uniref:Uncharacterized protein n=1 Tax=Caldicellulosiruptor diazotrophicus TaxID=2806205 RepID=A0ABN6E675_9FIRM|nr:hypothetical protein [Caldicellulosiruptor diazotrophicus]BCS80915.1 hypothetical protein CaldiYA01_08750 [Caldicellulosiruptor diazotrophicus]
MNILCRFPMSLSIYLVNDVFKNLFPLAFDTPFENYMFFSHIWQQLSFFLLVFAAIIKSDFTEDIAADFIQSFSKTIEHNTAYLTNLLQILEKNNVNTLAYMAILIRG